MYTDEYKKRPAIDYENKLICTNGMIKFLAVFFITIGIVKLIVAAYLKAR